jgi:hypothetical protein
MKILKSPQIEAMAKVAEEREGEEDPSPLSSFLFSGISRLFLLLINKNQQKMS